MFSFKGSSWQRKICIFSSKLRVANAEDTKNLTHLLLCCWFERTREVEEMAYRDMYIYQSSLHVELKICVWSWYCYSKEISFYGLVKHKRSSQFSLFDAVDTCVHKEYSVTRQMRGINLFSENLHRSKNQSAFLELWKPGKAPGIFPHKVKQRRVCMGFWHIIWKLCLQHIWTVSHLTSISRSH